MLTVLITSAESNVVTGTPGEITAIALLGFVAGLLGGLLGVGGSVVMIPGLTWVLGYNQHLYQAAAMLANVLVSVPAARRHALAGAVRVSALRWIMPAATVCVLFGVWLSNRDVFRGVAGGIWLGRVLAVYLVYVMVVNTVRLLSARIRGERGSQARPETGSPGRAVAVGGVMGTSAGLLGIGGGVLAVPLQQTLLGLPLRSCIANSSVVICVTGGVGAVFKNASLGLHGYGWVQGVTLAVILAPTCWLGGHLGAVLTHRLPEVYVRIALVVLLGVGAWKMAALP